MAKYPTNKNVKLDRIFLDLENPRHEPYETPAQVIEYLCRHENIFQLAKDIVAIGLNPIELFALIPDEDSDSKSPSYVVAEGNRRICALKLLNDPELAPTKLRKSFSDLAADWEGIDALPCVIFSDREAVDIWLRRIHDGEQGGIGRRKWNADQSARHSGDTKNKVALAILDYAEEHGIISADDRKGKLTTVQRYLVNKLVREALGIDAENPDDISRNRSKADLDLLLAKFIQDLQRGHVNSRSKKADIEAYARELGSAQSQSHKRVPPESLTKPKSKAKAEPKKKIAPKHKPKNFITFEQKIYNALEELDSHKLSNLYYSICSVTLESHTPLVSIGAWAFLESLSARAGRKTSTDFPSFFNKLRLQNYGLATGKGDKAIMSALKDISTSGDVTKHDGTAALFNGEQLANNMDTLKNLILKCIEEASELAK